MQTFKIENFLTRADFAHMGEVSGSEEPFFDVQGVYKGQITSTQQWIDVDSPFTKFIKERLEAYPEFKRNRIDGIQVLRAKKPYDVHSDWVVANNQVQLVDPKINIPTYTIVIPLIEGDYKTIVFDQGAEYNNFSDYKKENPELDRYVSDYAWKKYCSHCIKSDQRYLTIKDVFHWKRGSLFAFDRRLFHCSSNFSEASKKAIVSWLSV